MATRCSELPDLFRFEDGGRVAAPKDWPRRRQELAASIVEAEYGGMPPAPDKVEAEELHRSTSARLLDSTFIQFRLLISLKRSVLPFRLDVFVPKDAAKAPLVIYGDDCWRYLTDEIALEVLRRGNVLARFSRVEIAPDNPPAGYRTGLQAISPGRYGAFAAWAWAYHRCIDFLRNEPYVDAGKIAVIGHSRGGKATLLAGATDERIALTIANNSGCGGAGCYRWQGPKSEHLEDMVKGKAFWLAPGIGKYIGKEETLPFDQHFLKALVAPRGLLTMEALGDLWANPEGTWQTHLAAREAYRFLGEENRLGIHYREGGHDHSHADWVVALDFMEALFSGRQASAAFAATPFSDLPRCFSWSAPL